MWKRLKAYRDKIRALLAADDPTTDWEATRQEHLVQISFFQHERLIHLLVTLAFALMELMGIVATVFAPQPFMLPLMLLSLLFLVLLVPYLVHYYHLENGTQELYAQYDQLTQRAREQSQDTHASGTA